MHIYTVLNLRCKQEVRFPFAGNVFRSCSEHVSFEREVNSEQLVVEIFQFFCCFSAGIIVYISLLLTLSVRYEKSLRFFERGSPLSGNKRFSAIRKYKMTLCYSCVGSSAYTHAR